MFFKIPLDADLSNTSCRCKKEVNNIIYIEYNEGVIFDEWEEISEEEALSVAPEWFEANVSAPSQMDRIESMLNTLTADTVTEESIYTAIAEGVNEV